MSDPAVLSSQLPDLMYRRDMDTIKHLKNVSLWSILVCMAGCGHVYKYDNVSYGDANEALTAARKDISLALLPVIPEVTQIPGTAIVLIPPHDIIVERAVVKSASTKPDQYNYVANVLSEGYNNLGVAIKKAKVFESLTVAESRTLSTETRADWIIGLNLGANNTAQWYFKRRGASNIATIPIDTGKERHERPAAWVKTVKNAATNMLQGSYTESELAANKRVNLSTKEVSSLIPLTKTGGVYTVPVTVNEVLHIEFIIDSGASDVSISPDIALTLIKTGTIQQKDWLSGKTYQFADGSTAKSTRFRLQSIRIGDRLLEDINCSISNSINSPILLGQSALEKLGAYTIDYKKGILKLGE